MERAAVTVAVARAVVERAAVTVAVARAVVERAVVKGAMAHMVVVAGEVTGEEKPTGRLGTHPLRKGCLWDAR